MMEKLLHERLREYDEDTGRFKCSDGFEADISWKAARHLADEIERYYIPRPRFEDGEPVQFREKIALKRNGRKLVAHEFKLTKDGWFVTESGTWHPIDDIMRPVKVMASDGKEIVRGERLLVVETPAINGKVVGFTTQGREVIGIRIVQDDGSTASFKPEELTHDPTVFDLNHERFCMDDTVYHIDTGEAFKVTGLPRYGEYQAIQVRSIGRGCETSYDPELLTHREPDSQKLIDADAELSGNAYCRKHNLTPHEASCGKSTKYKHLFKRQRALIERGA